MRRSELRRVHRGSTVRFPYEGWPEQCQGQHRAKQDERDTPQWTTTAADIAGMGGELLLQTCYWDDDTMRFVALEGSDGVTQRAVLPAFAGARAA